MHSVPARVSSNSRSDLCLPDSLRNLRRSPLQPLRYEYDGHCGAASHETHNVVPDVVLYLPGPQQELAVDYSMRVPAGGGKLAKTHRFKFSQIVGLKSVHTMLHYAVSASQSLGCKQRGRQCQSIAKTQRADLRSKIPRVGVGGGGGVKLEQRS